MTITVMLNVKDANGAVSNEQRVIDSITGFQFQAILKVVNELTNEMKSDDSLKGLFDTIFGNQNVQDMEIGDISNEIIKNAIGSFETLAVKMPERAYQLLAAVSGIEYDLLMAQKVENIFDIYDAVVELNDVEKLVARIKKSLALTKTKTAFLNLGKKKPKPAAKKK